MKEDKTGYKIYHKPTKTIQVIAVIDFNNKTVDTYGINEPIYGIPFDDVEFMSYTDTQKILNEFNERFYIECKAHGILNHIELSICSKKAEPETLVFKLNTLISDSISNSVFDDMEEPERLIKENAVKMIDSLETLIAEIKDDFEV